jgi:uncharacterized membrane protein YphA (DoxX/SURF4 family)
MMKTNQVVSIVVSILLILLFTYAGVSKLMEFHTFTRQLSSSLLLKPIAGILTWLIPSIEFYTVILLLIPEWRKSGLAMSVLLMSLFTLYISVMLIFFDKLPCSCGGVFEKMTWRQHLVFNIAFTVAAAVAYRLHKHEKDLIAIEQDKPKT